MNATGRLLSCIALFMLHPPLSALADEDTLGDFEDSAGTGRENIGVEDTTDDADPNDASAAGIIALPVLIAALALESGEEFSGRATGDPATALIRLEGAYQRLTDGDVNAYALRGELVWAFVGLGAEFVSYREGSPKQSLDFTTVEGLFRLIPNDRLRVSFALGVRELHGKNDDTAVQGGVSFGAYPVKWAGLEFDLRWADIGKNVLEDYRAGVLLRHPDFPIAALRGGYRTQRVRGDSLSGGEVGVVLTF